jgi:hypothetical protein
MPKGLIILSLVLMPALKRILKTRGLSQVAIIGFNPLGQSVRIFEKYLDNIGIENEKHRNN